MRCLRKAQRIAAFGIVIAKATAVLLLHLAFGRRG